MRSNDPIHPRQIADGGLYHVGELHGYDDKGELLPLPMPEMHERLTKLGFVRTEDVYRQPDEWRATRVYPGETYLENFGDLSLYGSQFFRATSQKSWDYLVGMGLVNGQYSAHHNGLGYVYEED